MNTAQDPYQDARRPLDRLLGNYSGDHRHPTNQMIHWICVPPIVWTLVAALWVIPVPPWLGRPGFWAGAAMVAALFYYLKLSRQLALGVFVAFAVLAFLTDHLYRELGPRTLLWTAVAVFVLAWIGQFIGHHIEGRRPSFLTDLTYLLIGPLWLMAKLYRRMGWSY
ncbi:MAG TPA: Mpo1-like protein [Xanthomonadaceae bacterium]|nr:Mpo1-like protein [Xanthomonadaceae bacterium]